MILKFIIKDMKISLQSIYSANRQKNEIHYDHRAHSITVLLNSAQSRDELSHLKRQMNRLPRKCGFEMMLKEPLQTLSFNICCCRYLLQ